jgi:DNA adenine methylase
MKPIIKWVGGKQSNLHYIRERLPESFNTYYEPFLGGAAVLLDIMPTNAIVNDINPELINMYIQVRDRVDAVIDALTKLDNEHEVSDDPKAYYYAVRKKFNSNVYVDTTDQVNQAARFIYLNKHCFNGLYRVNKKGEFNVPFNGKLSGWSADPDHLREASTKLKSVFFRCGDYDIAVRDADKDSFVFLDPPYDVITDTSFTDYAKDGFGSEEQRKVSELFKELTERGCKCMLTNHDTPLIRELYKDFRIEVVDVRRSINRNGSDRIGKEVIITNYNPEGTDFKPIVIESHDEGDVV